MVEGIVIALIGGIVGWALSQFASLTSENASIVRSHIVDVEKFTEACQAYWLTKPESRDHELQLSARVKANQAAIATFYGEAERRLSTNRVRAYQLQQLRLFRAATGGTFETSNRGIDPARAIECYQISSQLVHTLRMASREQIWPLSVVAK